MILYLHFPPFPSVWMKIGAGDLHLMPLSSHGSYGNQYTESHSSLMGVNESFYFLSMYFCLIWNMFGIGDIHKNVFSNGQLRESCCSESHTFFNDTNEFLSVLSTIIFQFW
jgi:hypothetical protein